MGNTDSKNTPTITSKSRNSHTAHGRYTTKEFNKKIKNERKNKYKQKTDIIDLNASIHSVFQHIRTRPSTLTSNKSVGVPEFGPFIKTSLYSEELSKITDYHITKERFSEADTMELTGSRYNSLDNKLSIESNDQCKEMVFNNTMMNECKSKNGEEIRNSYIAKLIYKNILITSKKPKDHNNMIIFDWDDTLLCTSYITPNGVFNENTVVSNEDLEKLRRLEILVFEALSKSIDKGDTYIVTNAAPGWVEYSAKRFYPLVYKILYKVTIISARGLFERKFPLDSRKWKIETFLTLLNNIDVSLITNIICLGDSFIEMEAAHILGSHFEKAFVKTVKFRQSPHPEELMKQLVLINTQFDIIFSSIKNMAIKIEKKPKNLN